MTAAAGRYRILTGSFRLHDGNLAVLGDIIELADDMAEVHKDRVERIDDDVRLTGPLAGTAANDAGSSDHRVD